MTKMESAAGRLTSEGYLITDSYIIQTIRLGEMTMGDGYLIEMFEEEAREMIQALPGELIRQWRDLTPEEHAAIHANEPKH